MKRVKKDVEAAWKGRRALVRGDLHVRYECGENEGVRRDANGRLCGKCLADIHRSELESALGISVDPEDPHATQVAPAEDENNTTPPVFRAESYDVAAAIWAYAARYYVVPPGQEPEVARELVSRLREAYRIEPGLTNAWVELQEFTGEELIVTHFYEGDPSRRKRTIEGLFTPELVEGLIEDWEREN